MKTIKLALDWTPNINHIGFFIAQEKRFYEDCGINIEIVDPSSDNYAVTPAKKVEMGLVDFALCPTESIISYRTKEKPSAMIAVASILQEDLSAIAVKANSTVQSPKDLDGKRYASYKARYEDGIVKEMIRNDGGNGDLKIEYPDKLGIWQTVVNDSFDATWIFLNWEGVEAKNLDMPLRYFQLRDYQIPYSYSPVIATNETSIQANQQSYRNFLTATKRGYLFTQENPDESVKILEAYVPSKDNGIDLDQALAASSTYFGDEENWGQMNVNVVSSFLKWIYDNKLESKEIDVSEIFMNQLLAP